MQILACGSSYYAGTFTLPFFKKLGCFNTVCSYIDNELIVDINY